MKRIGSVALLLSLVAVALSGCYVVPAPPPLPGRESALRLRLT